MKKPQPVMREPDLRRLAVSAEKVELYIWVSSIRDYTRLTKVTLEIACDRNKDLALACMIKNSFKTQFFFRGINEDTTT